MSRLDEQFYGYEELPTPLANALFADSSTLSSHQFSNLLNMVRFVIDDCPPHHRRHFLPPLLSTLFIQADNKVSREWDLIEQRQLAITESDSLASEMKDESVLRQLTYSVVMMVAGLLDPGRPDPNASSNLSQSMRDFVLSTPDALEPVLLFCTHALRMRDSRCCSIITRVLRSIVPSFTPADPASTAIREFISSEVLKACITSVHEPYFVDLQKDLAQLIATIWLLYEDQTSTPRQVLLSLPGMTEAKIQRTADKLFGSNVGGTNSAQSGRHQRALILDLLEGLRGIRISEQGRFDKKEVRRRTAMQERYMAVEDAPRNNAEEGPDLAGVADMFG